LPTFDLKAYARRGAEARIAELTAELNDIYKAFPDLRTGGAKASAGAGRRSEIGNGRKRKRRGMTAAQKAEVSRRMKKYWAARRAKKGWWAVPMKQIAFIVVSKEWFNTGGINHILAKGRELRQAEGLISSWLVTLTWATTEASGWRTS
jgi:hypothetical protein